MSANPIDTPQGEKNGEPHEYHSKPRRFKSNSRRSRRGAHTRRPLKFNFMKHMDMEGTNYDIITSVAYLNEKYGLRKSHYIEKFIKCIHRKINVDVSRIDDKYIEQLSPWVKSKLFLLLVTLSERGGPEYWIDKNEPDKVQEEQTLNEETDKQPNEMIDSVEHKSHKNKGDINPFNHITTLTERIIQQNINHDFEESSYNEDYVFSSIWANFMEGLINHYLEKVIVPHSEMKVCQQLYKPMMKIISLYNEYNELMEKSERNGFLPTPTEEVDAKESPVSDIEKDDVITQERLQRAQKLLWQARQDIPKTISKELTLLSEMYSTLSADEQDYELDEFVCCAEEYIESEFLPGLISVLFSNCGNSNFWKVLLVLEPFFYYIEDVGEDDEGEEEDYDIGGKTLAGGSVSEVSRQPFKPDPRVITLEKICEVAARQKWI